MKVSISIHRLYYFCNIMFPGSMIETSIIEQLPCISSQELSKMQVGMRNVVAFHTVH